MLNKLWCHNHLLFSANQITRSRLLIQIYILNNKQCRSRSVGFFRRQLIWIFTVCKGRAYPGSAGPGLIICKFMHDIQLFMSTHTTHYFDAKLECCKLFKYAWIHMVNFMPFCAREITFVASCLLFLHKIPSEKRLTIKGKNLLPREQILSFYSRPLFRRETKLLRELPPLKLSFYSRPLFRRETKLLRELPPLKVYHLNLKYCQWSWWQLQ